MSTVGVIHYILPTLDIFHCHLHVTSVSESVSIGAPSCFHELLIDDLQRTTLATDMLQMELQRSYHRQLSYIT